MKTINPTVIIISLLMMLFFVTTVTVLSSSKFPKSQLVFSLNADEN